MHDDPPMEEELSSRFYPGFEGRWRKVEVAGRLVMLGMIAAAGAGYLGGGPVAVWTRTASAGGLEVTYQPVARFGTPSGLDMSLPAGPGAKEVAVTLPDLIAADFDLQSVTPQPVRWEPGTKAMRLVFTPVAGADRLTVHLGGLPPKTGVVRLSARLDGQQPLSWSQVILP